MFLSLLGRETYKVDETWGDIIKKCHERFPNHIAMISIMLGSLKMVELPIRVLCTNLYKPLKP